MHIIRPLAYNNHINTLGLSNMSGNTLFGNNTLMNILETPPTEDYFEKATPLHKGADPLLCVMIAGLPASTVFTDQKQLSEHEWEFGITAREISGKLNSGDELTHKGQLIVDKATEIREYYLARLVEEKLTNKDRRDSTFATDLAKALNVRGSIQPQYAGIYHKLQDFYDSDIKWDNFVDTHQSVSNNHEFASADSLKPITVELKFVDHLYSSGNKTLHGKTSFCRYYFTDKHDYLYEFSVPEKNILRPFLESYFQTFNEAHTPWKSVTISAQREVCPVPYYRNEFNYFKIFSWAGIRHT